jgi:hypothetical protein
MKTIKCSKGHDATVEDNYQLLTCPICLAKKKADYAVESAERDFDREAEKQLKSLFGDNPPPNLNYGKMKEFYQTHLHRELTWEQYLRDIQQAAIHKIRTDSDEKVREIRGEKAKRIKYNAKFLDFELYTPSSRDQCKKFRHQAMGSYPQSSFFMEEHVIECFECRMWNQVRESGMLNAEGSSEIWHRETDAEDIANLSPCKNEDCKTFRLMYSDRIDRTNDFPFLAQRHINCCSKWLREYRISIGEIQIPKTLDEYEEQHFKDCCLECGTQLIDGKCSNCQT